MKIDSLDKINDTAKEFVSIMGEHKVFVFYGSMGAGKTTFITALCKELGVTDVISSPTFAIVNEYETVSGNSIYHFDFYRINKVEEAFDFGYEDYFYSGNLCFIEWPEKVADLIPDNAVKVFITEKEDGSREIECQGIS
ncbi:MAG: tRNA (adenosine(37)-N6)-threonylcarbamoyltransferase complex ATPase subunit type 1 TsaE [Paludibacteraceae bacterium]|jgi:tRNA threonylcarbamoyladenosine biosynthesis protein TsaE|nr:tRNA (adenosine(37)-N6)-threonylcarbamoyltransferase complex ATPase subunit type 1 TsaE [Paludibacteraceae bacterium]MBO5987997.1 tRNA (adenosine(37)-N6)-threonylcarbamoyltransferase complex ATPase subunit type 1 TsaE [Paludibacteraceae bacterium]